MICSIAYCLLEEGVIRYDESASSRGIPLSNYIPLSFWFTEQTVRRKDGLMNTSDVPPEAIPQPCLNNTTETSRTFANTPSCLQPDLPSVRTLQAHVAPVCSLANLCRL